MGGWRDPCLLGQNQLVVCGNPQNITFIVMQDVYLPAPAQQMTTVYLFRRRRFFFVARILHNLLLSA